MNKLQEMDRYWKEVSKEYNKCYKQQWLPLKTIVTIQSLGIRFTGICAELYTLYVHQIFLNNTVQLSAKWTFFGQVKGLQFYS